MPHCKQDSITEFLPSLDCLLFISCTILILINKLNLFCWFYKRNIFNIPCVLEVSSNWVRFDPLGKSDGEHGNISGHHDMATVLKPHHHWFFLQSNDFAWTMPVCCIKDCIFLLYIKHHSGITYRLVPPDPCLKILLLLLVTNSSWWCPNQSVRVAVRPTLLVRQLCDLVQHHRHCHQHNPINRLSEWALYELHLSPVLQGGFS